MLSEAIDGAAAPPADLDRSRPDVVFGATLGTGVGGGIVIDGRVLTARTAPPPSGATRRCPSCADGEHAPYVCFCGHADCIESFRPGRGLGGLRTARSAAATSTRTEIGRRAAAATPSRRAPFALYEDALARALARS